jgi:hypothetical protein
MISQMVRNGRVRFGRHIDIEVSYKILRLEVPRLFQSCTIWLVFKRHCLEAVLSKNTLRPLGVKIRGFECGIWVFQWGGPLHSTGAGMLNHQTSKISPTSFWSHISLWVSKIRGFEGGIGVPKHGGPLNSTRVGLLNHQTSKISINSFWMKICLRVFKNRGLKGGIRVPKHGGSLNSTKVGC